MNKSYRLTNLQCLLAEIKDRGLPFSMAVNVDDDMHLFNHINKDTEYLPDLTLLPDNQFDRLRQYFSLSAGETDYLFFDWKDPDSIDERISRIEKIIEVDILVRTGISDVKETNFRMNCC